MVGSLLTAILAVRRHRPMAPVTTVIMGTSQRPLS
jgi:hypothetical protein